MRALWPLSFALAALALAATPLGAPASATAAPSEWASELSQTLGERLPSAADTRAPFRYTLRMADPQRHEFQLELRFEDLEGESVQLELPKWNPGAYRLTHAHRNLRALEARRLNAKPKQDARLPVAKLDENTWEVAHGGQPFSVSYRVYCGSYTGIAGCYLDPEFGFLNGVLAFMYVVGDKQRPIELRVDDLPGGGRAKVITGLPRRGSASEHRFWAANYDVLVDSPIHAGQVDLVEWELAGRPMRAMFSREGAWKADEVRTELQAITQTAVDIFGGPDVGIPFTDYTFLYEVLPEAGGGLEHLNSTAIGVDPWVFADRRGKRRFWGVSAHEFFHLWNVKRIRPAVLGPFDYDEEVHTTMLWFSEGFTSYYTSLILSRSGLLEEHEVLEDLERRIRAVEERAGRKLMSVEQSSWETWAKPDDYDKAYFSYYDKGAVIGMLFDLHLRHATKGQASTDSVFRELWQRWRDTGLGLTPAELEQAFIDAASRDTTGAAAEHMGQMYADYVHGVAELDYDRYLEHAGYRLERAVDEPGPWIGAQLAKRGDTYEVGIVDHGGPADRGGMADGDVLLAIDGHDFRKSNYEEVLGALEIGKPYSFTVARMGRQLELQISPVEGGETRYEIVELDQVSAAQSLLRREWLGLDHGEGGEGEEDGDAG